MALAAAQSADKPAVNVNEIAMHSQTALLGKTRLGKFDLALKRGDKFWSGDIDSTIAKGKFQFPLETKGISPVVMDMDLLNLTALRQLKAMMHLPAASSSPY